MWAPFFEFPCDKAAGEAAGAADAAIAGLAAAPQTLDEENPLTPRLSHRRPSAAPVAAVVGRGGRPGVGVGARAEALDVQGPRVKGDGRCLASVAIVQDRAYWELHVAEAPEGALLLAGSCVRPGDAAVLAEELGATPQSYGVRFCAGGQALSAGDVIGVAYDQAVFPVGIRVWQNGTLVAAPPPRGLKGEQWPAIFTSGGCVIDWALEESTWRPPCSCPPGFSALMSVRGLIG